MAEEKSEEEIKFVQKTITIDEALYDELTALKEKLAEKNRRNFTYADAIRSLLEKK